MKHLPFLCLAWLAFALTAWSEPRVLNGMAAVVNETVITYKDLFTAMADDEAFLERRFGRQPQVYEQKLRELQELRLEDLIERRLILDEFKKGGYNLSESVIEQRINEDIHRNYGNRLTLTKTLQAQGLTYEAYRTKVRERIIVQAMADNNVPRDPTISPQRIAKYYEEHREDFELPDQVKLRMITLTNRSPERVQRLAREITAKLDEGASFEEMAKIYSQDSKAREGGDRGWIDRKVLRPELTDKAFALESGERSGVIETPDASYILLVEEARAAHLRPLSEVREDIENTLKSEEIKRLHKHWVTRLKKKHYVKYY